MKTHALIVMAAASALALAGCHKNDDGSTPLPAGNVAAAPAPAGTSWVDTVAQTPDGGFQMGNPNAAVKLVEYGSRTCPHCGNFAKEAMPELKTFVATGKVSYEFRDFAIHAPDLAAILLGQCNGPSTFFPILEAMFADQVNTLPKLEQLPPNFQAQLAGKTANEQAAIWADYLGYTGFVGQRGVPEAKARACLADTKAPEALAKHIQDGTAKYNIQGTPTFVLNGEVLNTTEWKDVKARLQSATGG